MAKISEERRSQIGIQKPNYFAYWMVAAIVGIVLCMIVRSYVAKGYVVNTVDMANTLKKGDFVIVERISKNRERAVGDVVVFQYPADRYQYRFGRIMAVGGMVVEIIGKDLYVNGQLVENPKGVRFVDLTVESDIYSLRDNFGPLEVPIGSYLVLGDNRDRAKDSRNWGELRHDYILGRPLFVYFAWKPDPSAPDVNSIADLPASIFHNVTHFLNRLGFSRMGRPIR